MSHDNLDRLRIVKGFKGLGLRSYIGLTAKSKGLELLKCDHPEHHRFVMLGCRGGAVTTLVVSCTGQVDSALEPSTHNNLV